VPESDRRSRSFADSRVSTSPTRLIGDRAPAKCRHFAHALKQCALSSVCQPQHFANAPYKVYFTLIKAYSQYSVVEKQIIDYNTNMRYPWVCLAICGIWAATLLIATFNVVDSTAIYIYASVTVTNLCSEHYLFSDFYLNIVFSSFLCGFPFTNSSRISCSEDSLKKPADHL
jgi:hypothetical protein